MKITQNMILLLKFESNEFKRNKNIQCRYKYWLHFSNQPIGNIKSHNLEKVFHIHFFCFGVIQMHFINIWILKWERKISSIWGKFPHSYMYWYWMKKRVYFFGFSKNTLLTPNLFSHLINIPYRQFNYQNHLHLLEETGQMDDWEHPSDACRCGLSQRLSHKQTEDQVPFDGGIQLRHCVSRRRLCVWLEQASVDLCGKDEQDACCWSA